MREQTKNASQRITANENVALPERSLKSSLKIIEAPKKDPYSTYDSLAESLRLSRRAITKRIQKLKQEGILQRIGPDKRGHWEVRG